MATNVLSPEVKIIFQESLESSPQIFRSICAQIANAQGVHNAAWLGSPTALTPYTGRQNIVTSLPKYTYSIHTKRWEITHALDNTPGRTLDQPAIDRVASDLSIEVLQMFDRAAMDLIVAGTSALAFDGVAFFANSRTSGTPFADVDNIQDGTGITIEQLRVDLASARATMTKFKADNESTFINTNDSGWVIVAPVALDENFRYLLNAQMISGTSNITRNVALITSPVLDATDANDWYLLKIDNPFRRPLMYVETQAPMISFIDKIEPTDMASSSGIQAYCDFGFGYGDFRKAIKVKNT